MADKGVIGAHRELRAKRKGDFKNTVKQSFNVSPVPESADPSIPGSERAARDAARAPYVSPTAVEVRIDRIATRGETQLAEVLARPVAPERTFGVYRVPDRISGPLTPHSEKRRVVEWDIVHSPGAAPGVPLAATSFVAEEHWVARRPGEPSVLDEDLALRSVWRPGSARSAARDSPGSPSSARSRGSSDGETGGDIVTIVRGIVALHPARGLGCIERLRAAAPISLARSKASTSRCSTGARWRPRCTPRSITRRRRRRRSRISRHTAGAAAVISNGRCAAGPTVTAHRRPSTGRARWCRAGSSRRTSAEAAVRRRRHRMRTRGCEHVVIVYRDRAEYAEGVRGGPRTRPRCSRPTSPRASGCAARSRCPTPVPQQGRPRRGLRRASPPRPLGNWARRSCRRTATVGRRFEPLERRRRHTVGPSAGEGAARRRRSRRTYRRRPVRARPTRRERGGAASGSA